VALADGDKIVVTARNGADVATKVITVKFSAASTDTTFKTLKVKGVDAVVDANDSTKYTVDLTTTDVATGSHDNAAVLAFTFNQANAKVDKADNITVTGLKVNSAEPTTSTNGIEATSNNALTATANSTGTIKIKVTNEAGTTDTYTITVNLLAEGTAATLTSRDEEGNETTWAFTAKDGGNAAKLELAAFETVSDANLLTKYIKASAAEGATVTAKINEAGTTATITTKKAGAEDATEEVSISKDSVSLKPVLNGGNDLEGAQVVGNTKIEWLQSQEDAIAVEDLIAFEVGGTNKKTGAEVDVTYKIDNTTVTEITPAQALTGKTLVVTAQLYYTDANKQKVNIGDSITLNLTLDYVGTLTQLSTSSSGGSK
jgi:hypothetical protein